MNETSLDAGIEDGLLRLAVAGFLVVRGGVFVQPLAQIDPAKLRLAIIKSGFGSRFLRVAFAVFGPLFSI